MEFNTVSISDGITMGSEGMRASLVSREVVADSIELVARGNLFDGLVVLVGCDKTIPGGVMALVRLNIPGLLLYGGSIAPGSLGGSRRHDSRCVRGCWNPCRREDDRYPAVCPRRQCLSRPRRLWWSIHRQHHGHRLWISRCVSYERQRRAGDGRHKGRGVARGGRDCDAAGREGSETAADRHAGIARERHRFGSRDRGINQRGAAPVGHRERG